MYTASNYSIQKHITAHISGFPSAFFKMAKQELCSKSRDPGRTISELPASAVSAQQQWQTTPKAAEQQSGGGIYSTGAAALR
jgi:hypothetical protein